MRASTGGPFSLLFGFTRPVDRVSYALVGVVLMAIKLGGDLWLLARVTDRLWLPWQYFSFLTLADNVPMATVRVLMLWALPFAWIGLSMTTRRAIDAGLTPWAGLLFCLPYVNLAAMVMFCFLPSRPPATSPEDGEPRSSERAGLRVVGAAVLLAITMVIVSVVILEEMGVVLFAGTPLGMGLVVGYGYNRGVGRKLDTTITLALAALIAVAALLLLFAFEGLYCLLMALPLGAGLIAIGALIGREVALGTTAPASPLLLLIVVLPLLAWAEPGLRRERLHQVTTRIEIDAPPATVWRHVVSFAPLAPPREPWFRHGIAYPTRARIAGRGVGAVRYCEFSTGTFVEPITVWDEPRHLAFDVTDQPAPLRELSPYPRVWADHRHPGSVNSRRGEFRLLPAPGGGTILEGSTWYQISLFPEAYWTFWSDLLIRSIHLRVLRHIEAQARGSDPAPRAVPE